VATRLKRARARAAPSTSSASATADRFAVAMLIAIVIVANVALTWGRWGDVITDVGRELDTALQVSQGRCLYADVRSYYGPLAPYLNAVLFRLFGARVEVLAAAGVLTGTLLSIAVYRCVRLFAGRPVATATAFVVLQAGVFAQTFVNNIFNFVVPYSYAATYGTLLATASVYFLLRHLLAERPRDLWLSAGLLALVAASKLEPLFAAAVAHLVAVASLAIRRRASFSRLAPYLLPLGGILAIYGYFYSKAGPALFHDNLFLKSNATAGGYALRYAGLLDWPDSLAQLALSAVSFAVCGAAAAWASRGGGVAKVMAAATVIAGVAGWTWTTHQLLVLPLALAVAGVDVLWRARRARCLEARDAARLTLLAFGLAALARVVLHAVAEHYGFYLVIPAVAACGAWIGGTLPGLLPPSGRGPAAVLAAVWLAVVGATHALDTHLTAVRTYGAVTPAVVRSVRGALPLPVPYVGVVDSAVRYLETQPRGSRVLAVPHGVGIAFLAGLQNALGVHALLPPDVAGGYDDARLIADLERNPPDFIVYTSADTSEYGKRGFGVDYAVDLALWIEARYERRDHWRNNSYYVAVLGRKPAR
jgi:hypothetical protein